MKTATRCLLIAAVAFAVPESRAADDATSMARWSFEQIRDGTVADAVGNQPGTVKGTPQSVAGVDGQALRFDGCIVSVPSAPSLQFADATFSIAAWVNPYELGCGQQMIVAKNVYSAGKREWGLMLDNDNRFRFYLWQNGWKTLASPTEPRPGHWHHVAVTVEKGRGRLYINGKQEAENAMASSVPVTDAPLTIAVSKPGESDFSKVFLIRTSVFEGTPGVSDPKADFSYPYAVEHEGKLYIGYTHKSHAANELAVIPVSSLAIKP